jgi:hypothetical protein
MVTCWGFHAVIFCDPLFRMNFFTKPMTAEVETVPRVTPAAPLHTAQSNLTKTKLELADARKVLESYRGKHQDLRRADFDGNQTVCLGAMTMYPELQKLERDYRAKEQAVSAALAEFAAAKKFAGMGSY